MIAAVLIRTVCSEDWGMGHPWGAGFVWDYSQYHVIGVLVIGY
jgi:hypothetical protein